MISQRPGSSLESFLEVFCFNLTEHEPVRVHGEPIHAFVDHIMDISGYMEVYIYRISKGIREDIWT